MYYVNILKNIMNLRNYVLNSNRFERTYFFKFVFITDIETKKKWNNVRDCYRRDLVKMKANPAKGQKKYIYANLLSFLTPMFKIKE